MKGSMKPEELFQIFFECNLAHIPIVRGQDIMAYISREKVQRHANHMDFFKNSLLSQLNNILMPNNESVTHTFFEEVEQKSPSTIPVVDSMRLTFRHVPGKEFYDTFRPIHSLNNDAFKGLFMGLCLPCFVLNSKHELIHMNRLAEGFKRRHFGKKASLLECFSGELEGVLRRPNPNKIYVDRRAKRRITYKCQRLAFERGFVLVVCVIGLSAVASQAEASP